MATESQVIPLPQEDAPQQSTGAGSRLRHESAGVSAFTWGAVAAVAGSWLYAAPLWAGFLVGFLAVASVLSLALATEPR